MKAWNVLLMTFVVLRLVGPVQAEEKKDGIDFEITADFYSKYIVREHPDVIDHWIAAWNDAPNFKESEPENYVRILSRLNGSPTPEPKKSFDGIFFASLAENRITLGTPERSGYLLESLKEMEKFMLDQGVIQQPVDLQNLIEFEGIQRFFNK